VTLSANQVAGAMERMVACVRPEAIVIGHAAGAAANSIAGQVVDVIYTAGTLRYRVDVGGGHVVTVRRPSQRQAAVIEVGAPVHLSWDAADTLLIPLD
jgi:putative spermidine/putrescine transport system ATP-binding protein